MFAFLDPLRELNTVSMLVRLAVAVAIGGVIGLERSSKNRPAGFRTHILVCMGAAVATMTALYIFLKLKLPTDVSRMAAQVISGLGFIGAGTIVITKPYTIHIYPPSKIVGTNPSPTLKPTAAKNKVRPT